MSRQKKSRNQDRPTKVIILITAILNLIAAAIKLIELLTG